MVISQPYTSSSCVGLTNSWTNYSINAHVYVPDDAGVELSVVLVGDTF